MAFVYKPLPAYSIADEDCKNCMNGDHRTTYQKEEKTMKKEFTKNDLKNRMVVEYRDGKKRIVVDDILMGNDGYANIRDYNDDLTNPFDSNRDIIKVFDEILYFDKIFETYFGHLLLWERKEPKEVTLKEIAEKFGVDEVKIIDG